VELILLQNREERAAAELRHAEISVFHEGWASLAEPLLRQGIDYKLPDKIGHGFGNRFRGGELLFSVLDHPHDPCHIFA